MKKIIKQINNNEVFNVVSRIHEQDDFINGDIGERLDEYKYYNHLEGYLLATLKPSNYSIDQDKVIDIIEEIKQYGIKDMPKIIIDDLGNIIDGVHRIVALLEIGYNKIDILQGTNKKFEPYFKKELINENLKIYKISNDFGSISVMENAKYSPAENSISEFLVDEKYRNLGVGTELLKEAMKQYNNLGAQISSLASLKVFLECGFEPFDLKNTIKLDLDTTSYDFKIFNKSPRLLNGQAAMYRNSIENFNKKLSESVSLFNENGGSIYFNDKRELNKKRLSLRVK